MIWSIVFIKHIYSLLLINVKKDCIWKQVTYNGLENGSLGFIEYVGFASFSKLF